MGTSVTSRSTKTDASEKELKERELDEEIDKIIRPNRIYKELQNGFIGKDCEVTVLNNGTIVYRRKDDSRRNQTVKLEFRIVPFTAEKLEHIVVDAYEDGSGFQRLECRQHVAKIMRGYDEHYNGDLICYLNSFPMLSERPDGKLVVIDGQHRILAAKRKGLGIICAIVKGYTDVDERCSFVINNSNKKINGNLYLDNQASLPNNKFLSGMYEILDAKYPEWRSENATLSRATWCNSVFASIGRNGVWKWTDVKDIEKKLADTPVSIRNSYVYQCFELISKAYPFEKHLEKPKFKKKRGHPTPNIPWWDSSVFWGVIRFITQVMMKYGNSKKTEKDIVSFLSQYDVCFKKVRENPIEHVKANHWTGTLIHNWNNFHYGKRNGSHASERLPFPEACRLFTDNGDDVYPYANGPLENDDNLPHMAIDDYTTR